MGGDESGVVGITQRKLLMEMRDDIRALRSVVDSVAREAAARAFAQGRLSLEAFTAEQARLNAEIDGLRAAPTQLSLVRVRRNHPLLVATGGCGSGRQILTTGT
jgi:hypothetical protein